MKISHFFTAKDTLEISVIIFFKPSTLKFHYFVGSLTRKKVFPFFKAKELDQCCENLSMGVTYCYCYLIPFQCTVNRCKHLHIKGLFCSIGILPSIGLLNFSYLDIMRQDGIFWHVFMKENFINKAYVDKVVYLVCIYLL